MYGVGQLTLGTVLTEARCRVTFIHERHNPLFGGRSPAPNPGSAASAHLDDPRRTATTSGLAMDGDADRIAIVDERGEYISINDVLLLLYWYMHEVRGERGGVVRNLSTTHMLDRMAQLLGEECYEVPVGFKHIVQSMVEHNAVLGGESSGGLDDSRTYSGQGRHLRIGAGGGNAGSHRQEDLAVARACLRNDGQAV